ncbi:glycosyltransferase family 9 protein [Robiginitalea sp. IMCC43444]|uniref:glycosyltransferase family 9 protein n=1 Tax=Robiginitalea sp. IMCC43444 TaxID=3459121 RepID=UPI004041C313
MKKSSEKKVLILRFSAMGDVAMTIPVILALVTQYPQLQITVVSRKAFAALFERIPGISFYAADLKDRHKGLVGLWRLYRELKALQPDFLADLHNVLRTKVIRLYFRATRLGVAVLNKGRAEKRALTRTRNKDFRQLRTTHQRYAGVFSSLGLPVTLTAEALLPTEPWPLSFKEHQPASEVKCIGLAPFAAHSGKCYPEDRIKELIGLLEASSEYKVLLFGGGKEEIMHLKFWESEFSNCICVAGELSFSDELALISNLDLMISMDSGNGHLAALFGLAVITVWGVTHPYAGFAPFNQPEENWILPDLQQFPEIPTSVYGNKVPEGYERVMETIAPQTIYNRVRQILHSL